MSEVTVSLTPPLHESLSALIPLLPSEQADELTTALTHPTIPYPLLLSISRWTRHPDAQTSLRKADLEPSAYAMVPLLAGSKTDPDRHFPPHVPQSVSLEEAASAKETKKQITALLNGLLSVIGAGVAAWFVGRSAGWRNEWRVLLGLGVAAVVALSEAGLWLIYSSRQNSARERRRLRLAQGGLLDKKDEDKPDNTEDEPPSVVALNDHAAEGLRRRIQT